MNPISLRKRGWRAAGMLGFPLITLTAYLLWVWPRPAGTSLFAEVGPYFISLLTGLPFALGLARGPHRIALVLAFFVLGFVAMFFYAVAVLCGIRNVCL
ncbi:MAG: hypothetical protein WAK92_10140 [Thiobacillus sp.]